MSDTRATGVPLVMFLIISLGFNRNVWDGHSAFLGLVLAQAISRFRVCYRSNDSLTDVIQPSSLGHHGRQAPFAYVPTPSKPDHEHKTATKLCAGRPRPDVIDRCQPEDGAANAVLYGLTTVSVCTQTDKHILNGAPVAVFSILVFLTSGCSLAQMDLKASLLVIPAQHSLAWSSSVSTSQGSSIRLRVKRDILDLLGWPCSPS